MKTSIIGLAFAGIGTLALAACATDPSTADAPKKTKVVVTVADAETAAKIPAGYFLVRKGGKEYYCHDEPVVGSRTEKNQVCETKEQMDATRNKSANTTDYAQGR